MSKHAAISASLALAALALAGCGGGGGGSKPPASTWSLGGSVTGAHGALTLRNNGGSDLRVEADGAFTIATGVASGATYSVTVASAPDLQTCSVSAGSGTATGNVTNILVTCTDAPPTLSLTAVSLKALSFGWTPVPGATRFEFSEDLAGSGVFAVVTSDITATATSFQHAIAVHRHAHAHYRLAACSAARCVDSNAVSVDERLIEAIGYVKASNTGPGDLFGRAVALSADAQTLAVGASGEDSSMDGDGSNESAPSSGAVYVYSRVAGEWQFRALLKAPSAEADDLFGSSVALSADGSVLAVGAIWEDSSVAGVNGDQANNDAKDSGAVYVFRQGNGAWNISAYLKASNTGISDYFGTSLALSADGRTLVVGAPGEDSNARGANGNQLNEGAEDSGAAYVFQSDGVNWNQFCYLKASNTGSGDQFGADLALSGDGFTIAVAARSEDSSALGIDGDQSNNASVSAGAVYVYRRGLLAFDWPSQAYVKAPERSVSFGRAVVLSRSGDELAVSANAVTNAPGTVFTYSRNGATWSIESTLRATLGQDIDGFGEALALSADGTTLAAGALNEDGGTRGIDGDPTDESESDAGAAYVFKHVGPAWTQSAYVKASNTGAGDKFGNAVALSADGETLAVGATLEDGNGRQLPARAAQEDNSMTTAGAVYLY